MRLTAFAIAGATDATVTLKDNGEHGVACFNRDLATLVANGYEKLDSGNRCARCLPIEELGSSRDQQRLLSRLFVKSGGVPAAFTLRITNTGAPPAVAELPHGLFIALRSNDGAAKGGRANYCSFVHLRNVVTILQMSIY